MVVRSQLLNELRSLTGNAGNSPPLDREFWQAPDFSQGVAQGIVVELLGNACTEWLIRLFVQNPEPYILWCEHESKVLPTAIVQRGVQGHRIKFVISTGDLYPALRVALESQHYPFVVAPNSMTRASAKVSSKVSSKSGVGGGMDVTSFQRLHLLAEKAKSTIFLLAEKKFSQAWPISLQLEINNSLEGFQITVHRQKHGHQQRNQGSNQK